MEAECYLLFKVGDPRMTPQTLIHILITDPGKLTDPPSRMTAADLNLGSGHQGMKKRQTDKQREC